MCFSTYFLGPNPPIPGRPIWRSVPFFFQGLMSRSSLPDGPGFHAQMLKETKVIDYLDMWRTKIGPLIITVKKILR